MQSSVEGGQASADRGITRRRQRVLFAGYRRPVRTTNSSQRGNRSTNVHRCIIDDISNEITAK